MTKIISSSDEGVQLNVGTRLGFLGSGYQLPHFETAVKILKKYFAKDLKIASNQEDDWLLDKLESKNPNLYRSTIETLGKKNKLDYIGQLDFGDPRLMDDEISKGHLVRPPKVHIGDTICFTCGGGEQTFNLRNFVVSADFASQMPAKALKALLTTQIDFCTKLIGHTPNFTWELDGELGKDLATKNQTAVKAVLPELK